jgi:prophage DNA circulation protein
MSPRFDAIAESQLVDGEAPYWLDQLRECSFRGVPFKVDTVEWTAGDNVVLREYPFQDLPTVFRMGAAAQEIKFSAYLIGPDYHLQRAALMDALTGEGVLMHPTAGAMRVFVAGKFTVKENPSAEGGMARLDLHFVRAEARRYPAGAPNTQATASDKAEAAKMAAAGSFASQWSVERKPGWAAQQAVARIKAGVDGVIGPIRTAAAGLNSFISEVNASYRALVDGLDALVSAPRQLADAVSQIYRLPTDLSNAAARDFQAAFAWGLNLDQALPKKPFEVSVMPPVGAGLVMYGTGLATAAPGGSVGQQQLAELLAAGDQFLETLATAVYVQATAALELGNYDEALAMRKAVHNQLVRLMQAASTAEPAATVPAESWHDAMQALHGAALADLQARSRDLVRLTTYTPESWQPVWYVSYRLYGTAAYVDEILAMNPHIRHPVLVPPGRPLRIVRHD